MTKDEIQDLAQALRKPPSENAKYIDWLFKAFIALLVYFGQETMKDVELLKDDVNKILTESEYEKKQLQEFKEFASQPRFTQQNFDANIKPLVNQMNQNTSELNTRGPVINGLQEKFIRIEVKLDALLEKMKE